jgi:methyl-accepting chemotaxis protein
MSLVTAAVIAVIAVIDQMSVQLATATEETSSTAEQNTEQISKQQKQIEQVATATEEMSATAAEISENIQRVADAADNSLQSKEKGAAAVRESITSVRLLKPFLFASGRRIWLYKAPHRRLA